MKRTFIINGQRKELTINRVVFSRDLLDVTPIGNQCMEWTDSGENRIELSATAEDGSEIKGVFRILSQYEEGVLQIAPFSDFSEVGNGE